MRKPRRRNRYLKWMRHAEPVYQNPESIWFMFFANKLLMCRKTEDTSSANGIDNWDSKERHDN